MLRRHNDASLEFVRDFQKPARHRRQLDRLGARAQDDRDLQGMDFIAPGSSPVPQVWQELFVPVGDSAFGQIVRRHFERNFVPVHNLDPVPAKSSRHGGQYCFAGIQFYRKHPGLEFFNYFSHHFNCVFFWHIPLSKFFGSIIDFLSEVRTGKAGSDKGELSRTI